MAISQTRVIISHTWFERSNQSMTTSNAALIASRRETRPHPGDHDSRQVTKRTVQRPLIWIVVTRVAFVIRRRFLQLH